MTFTRDLYLTKALQESHVVKNFAHDFEADITYKTQVFNTPEWLWSSKTQLVNPCFASSECKTELLSSLSDETLTDFTPWTARSGTKSILRA